MKQKIYSILPGLAFGVLIICFLVVFYVLAWTEPSSAPPSGSVPAPINVGGDSQIKSGKVGIGDLDPSYGLTIFGPAFGEGGIKITATSDKIPLFVEDDSPDSTPFIINQDGNVGIGTAAPEFRLTLDKGATNPDGGILAIGARDSGTSLTTSGEGTRLIWYPRKGAFRAGSVMSDQWDNSNIGYHSVAMGEDTEASGHNSVAMGFDAVASGFTSTAIGSSTTASGICSTALGSDTTAQSFYSTVLGAYNVISGNPFAWIATDPLFVIGNGGPGSPSNAVTVLKNGNVGIGTADPKRKLEVSGGDVYINQTSGGLIMKSPDGTCSSCGPDNSDVWSCTSIACP